MWKKVVAPTVVVCLLWVTFSSATTYYINQMFDEHERLLSENVTTIHSVSSMRTIVWRIQAISTHSSERLPGEARAEVTELEKKFQGHLVMVDQSTTTPEDRRLVVEIGEKFANYRDHIHQQIDPPAGNATAAESSEVTLQLARAVTEPCRKLGELNEQFLAESAGRHSALSESIFQFRMIFLILGPALGLVLGLWVARGLQRSISQLSVTLTDAAGDLEQEIGHVKFSPASDLPVIHDQVRLIASRIREVLKELHSARREAMQSERLAAVGELAAGVAHELRNPLTSVKLLIQMAAERSPSRAMTEEQLHVVQQEISRMEGTIQGLLDFARPPQLRRVRHDLRDTVRRALNLVEGHARQLHVEVVSHFSTDPLLLDGDPDQLHQVFVNLLLNGMESMPEGGRLEVNVENSFVLGGPFRITVADSGTGIPAAVLPRLFEPFVTTKERGTGLGLAISRRIVSNHGGALVATNRAEGGAAFLVELPQSPASDVAVGFAKHLEVYCDDLTAPPSEHFDTNPSDMWNRPVLHS